MLYRLRTLLAQFSIRDLLWLVALAAVISSWLRDRRLMEIKLAAERAADAVKLQRKLDISANEAQMMIEAKQQFRKLLQEATHQRFQDDDPTHVLPLEK